MSLASNAASNNAAGRVPENVPERWQQDAAWSRGVIGFQTHLMCRSRSRSSTIPAPCLRKGTRLPDGSSRIPQTYRWNVPDVVPQPCCETVSQWKVVTAGSRIPATAQALTRIACALSPTMVSYQCTSNVSLDHPSATASAHLSNASAIFSRNGNAAELRLDIRTPAVVVVFEGGQIEEAVTRCCEQEIEFVRIAFDKIGVLLCDQLDDRDDLAHINDSVGWKEDRSWTIQPGSFNVAGTRQSTTSQIDIANAPSNAALVREAIRVQLRGRILAIRDVYRQMLSDVRNHKRSPNPKKTV